MERGSSYIFSHLQAVSYLDLVWSSPEVPNLSGLPVSETKFLSASWKLTVFKCPPEATTIPSHPNHFRTPHTLSWGWGWIYYPFGKHCLDLYCYTEQYSTIFPKAKCKLFDYPHRWSPPLAQTVIVGYIIYPLYWIRHTTDLLH